jgi:hypothetical protein
MPVNTALAQKIWNRYAWCRDNGHSQFVEKADKCDRFFRGDQWESTDRQALKMVRRPALTINKILSTVSNVMGEQINNRSEISFRPRFSGKSEVADSLTKLFKQISDNNKLDWLRSDVFTDGIITSRGFFDVRIGFNDHMQGEVIIDALNPKNVIIDPDGEQYDPDTWSDVFVTKWVTADDIAVMYNEEDAEFLRARDQSFFPYGYDSINSYRDRFGERYAPQHVGDHDHTSVQRSIRLIDRQYRALDRQRHFVSLQGDTRPVPDDFDDNKIAFFRQQFGFEVVNKLVRRIRWTVIADQVVLHDDWGPYEHYTVVPYFPYFRHGQTIGIVENLLDPQELLNKVSSQELHVVNTTANSGYKVKKGSLKNMTVEELEQRGAQTGIVLEVENIDDLEKLTPNSVPTGLDRISFKAEEHIKTISGIPDSLMGQDRADVAAKAIQQKREAAVTNLVKPLDNLVRSDHLLARNVLSLVQRFYTEERVGVITKDPMTQETETFVVNQVTTEGEIVNDLTLGEYDVIVSSVPVRETMEDSQFEQAVALRELGVPIPVSVLLESSRLRDKKRIMDTINEQANSAEARERAELEKRAMGAEVSKTEAEARSKDADAVHKQAKAQKESVLAEKEAMTPPETGEAGPNPLELEQTAQEMELAEREFQHKQQMDFAELGLKRQKMQSDIQQDAIDRAERRATQRAESSQRAAAAAQKPAPSGE